MALLHVIFTETEICYTNYTNCIYFLVQLKNKYAMVNADTNWN